MDQLGENMKVGPIANVDETWGKIVHSARVGMGLRVLVFAYLAGNLWYRFSTVFDYSRFVGAVLIFLGLCSLTVMLFPRFLKAFLFLFGASFFLFGFRGYDIQSQVFETLVVVVSVTLFFVNVRRVGKIRAKIDSLSRLGGLSEERKDGRQGAGLRDGGTGGWEDVKGPARLNRQLVGMMLCYIGLSVLSLQLLPLGHIAKDFWLIGWKSAFLQVANATPNSWLYPLAGINRLVLFFIFAVEVARGREARDSFKWLFVGIFAGGVFCAFIGLLDYYGVISLAWYRFGTTGTPGALHSTFLNRSWLAEYILMIAPFVLIGFMSRIGALWWKILLLASLVLCEIALLLGGARGGWVSYPLILFICWLFFYFSQKGRLESFHFTWQDLAKVAVSVPITIVISLLLVFQVIMPLSNHLREGDGGKVPKTKPSTEYIERQAARIIEPSGRLKAWTQGLDVGRERPLFGMGYEAFCWHADILSGLQDSIYSVNKANKHNRVLDTPHNIYFQLFVSGGVVGLCLWSLVIGYSLVILVVDLIRNKRLLNVPVIISIISFHTYGIFQSMQYIAMIWMFIFLTMGYAMTIDDKILPVWLRRLTGAALKAMVCLVVIGGIVYFVGRGSQGLAEKYGLAVYARDQDWHKYHGFYHREKGPAGNFRWSGKRGLMRINEGGLLQLRFECHTPGVDKEPVTTDIRVDDKLVDRLFFERVGAKDWGCWLGGQRTEVGGGKSEDTGREVHEILIEVSRTWNPKRMGVSADARDLGLAVGEPNFLKKMPKNGFGFYPWEDLDAQSADRIAHSLEVKGDMRFRWTGRRGIIAVRSQMPDDRSQKVVFLRCSHPDIGKEPVVVRIWGNGMLLRHFEFADYDWRKVVFEGKELDGMEVMTFEVSRTWNPKRMGVSEDGRDLGVAVAIP